MYDARVTRVAALYKSGSSTDSRPNRPESSPVQDASSARAWQAELAKSIAEIERRRRR